MDARLAKNLCRSEARWREEVMPAGSSGEVTPTSSGSDAGAYTPGGKMSQSADTGQSPSVPLCGQTKTFEKEHCGEVRCAHERRENFSEPVW
ncbi:hypothetical protein [Mesotoga sp. BH458_6_3_2_1]|uniref:hypothetical protein n=1 Tax=Mesotoga sp. BH458_6_3_2_1 TaxID=1437446 RepID=UPI000EF1FE4D|nr:hypothetical protein [Mesotoga sp. BH458_6_3_2_1]RLL85884.1 hypothetical protein Y697_13695 [Mesotoga sp. BH458_6_3_2_1]